MEMGIPKDYSKMKALKYYLRSGIMKGILEN